MTLTKTKTEIEREHKHASVINLYKQLKQQNPLAKPYRVMTAVGNKLGYTAAGVRKILEQHNVPLK